MRDYPETSAVIIRRHGMYVWGPTWQRTKGMYVTTVIRPHSRNSLAFNVLNCYIFTQGLYKGKFSYLPPFLVNYLEYIYNILLILKAVKACGQFTIFVHVKHLRTFNIKLHGFAQKSNREPSLNYHFF